MAIQVTAELLDGAVLAVLDREDTYGYRLTQQIQDAVQISTSTIYPVLRRLKKNGLLTTYDQPFQGRNRRYYEITAAGRDRLSEIKAEWTIYKDGFDLIFYGVTGGKAHDN